MKKSHFLVCLTQFLLVSGLFEDQIGKFDWRQQFVGNVEYMLFDQSYGLGKRIIVSTDKSVLASIHSFNGSIIWRVILEEGERGIIDSIQHKGNYLVAVCGGGRYVRSWNPGTGTLMWEIALSHDSGYGADIKIHGKDDVIALTPTGLYNLDIHNGKEKWKMSLPDGEKTVYNHLAIQDSNILAIGKSVDGHVRVVTVDTDGVQKTQKAVPAAWMSKNTECLIVKDNYFMCFESQSKSFQLLDISTSETFKASDPQDLGLDTSGILGIEHVQSADVPDTGAYVMVRMSGNNAAVVKLSSKGVKLFKNLPKVTAVQISKVDNSEIKILLALHKSAQDEATLTGYDLESGGEIAELSQKIHFPAHHGYPLKIEAVVSKKNEGRLFYKMIVKSEDFSLLLVHKTGKVAWHREEALAYVMSADMIDLPVSENQAKFEDEFGSHKDDIATMFIKRFSTQFSQLKTFIIQQVHKLQGHRHHHVLDSDTMEDEEEDDEELTRDEFNLNKMIILVTAAGKIYGMKSTNGRPEWQLFLPELSPFSRYGKEKLFLFVQRTTAHFPNPPQCTVLGRNKRTGEGHIFSFNPITGKPIKGMPPTGIKLTYNVLQVSMLGKMDENFLKGIILLDENYKIYMFPESFRKVVEEDVSSIFMFVADISTGIISGFKTQQKNKELISNKVWTVNLQKKQQTITGIYSKRAVEHVHSQGRVLGDRSVLYKYLNPNLIVIVTEGEDTTSSSQKGPGNFMSIYLIDSVTGHMVFHCSHKRSKGPVNVIHSENWVVYNYFNQKSRRYEIAVLELFEGKDQSNATAFSSFSAPREPLVLRQSYIMPLAISTMATTITEKGITSKNIIFALKLGGLLSLPKALLDPRRPIIPTQETMEEGTIPYIPELPVSTEAVINYNQSVYNVRDIHTSPAGLESTSLVLSYGLDLFFTRVTPSKMFDVLKEDFDYYFISLVLGGMFLVSFVSQKLAGRKALSRAWK